MNTSNINPQILFKPFKTAIGEAFDKVCNDTKSFLGRLDKDIVSKGGEWKSGTKGAMVSKEGHKLQLPLNNPMSTLILFGLDIQDITRRMYGKDEADTNVQFDLPTVCKAWITEQNEVKKEVKA